MSVCEITDLQGAVHTLDFDNLQSDYINVDCMDALRQMPDKCIDLAVVDPPYGDCGGYGLTTSEEDSEGGLTSTTSQKATYNGAIVGRFGGLFEKYHLTESIPSEATIIRTGGTWASKYGDKITHWDVAPTQEYFDELFRVSKNQVIWGANYFNMPPCRCFLVWEKLSISETFSMAMAEYAWTSFNDKNAKIFKCAPQGNAKNPRIHPTEKPMALYNWIYGMFAERGMTILDTHCGSANSLRSAHDCGLTYIGFELDKYYYKQSKERLDRHKAQMNIFDLMEEDNGQKPS